MKITKSYLSSALGSARIEMGNTWVICTAAIEERVPPFLVGREEGWLTAEYGMLPGSSPRRISRESASGRPNSRTREIQRLIGRSLRCVVDLKLLGERTVYLDCDVIQADGGTRTASITGAYVAPSRGCRKIAPTGIAGGRSYSVVPLPRSALAWLGTAPCWICVTRKTRRHRRT